MPDAWTSRESAPWPFARSGTLTTLPRRHHPRESVFAKGVSALGTTELLALVLGDSSGTTSVFELACRLVRRHGLKGLGALSPRDLKREPGVGVALAARLAAAFELGRRSGAGEGDERVRITRPNEAWRLTRDLGRAKKEHLLVGDDELRARGVTK
jgi:DNA repair protein RadC